MYHHAMRLPTTLTKRSRSLQDSVTVRYFAVSFLVYCSISPLGQAWPNVAHSVRPCTTTTTSRSIFSSSSCPPKLRGNWWFFNESATSKNTMLTRSQKNMVPNMIPSSISSSIGGVLPMVDPSDVLTGRRPKRRLTTALNEAATEAEGTNEETPIELKTSPPQSKRPRQTKTKTKTKTSSTKDNVEKGMTTPSTPKKTTTNKKKGGKNTTTPRRKRSSSPPKPLSIDPPDNWQDIYELVEELRQDRSAPVDSDGSEALPETQHGEKVRRFQVLIALMLSSQTKDAVVGETMRSLQKHGLTVENIAQTSPEKLNQLIGKVGFHNNKTKYIKGAVEMLLEEYQGDIPESAQDMMKLPGVGPKMAFIIENVAWNKTTGIGVDTHMHRMFNELGWVSSKNPEQTRKQLEAWLPLEHWSSVNYLWVGFGQEVQQFKPKLLQKVLNCSRPADALHLVQKLGLDYHKEGKKLDLEKEIRLALNSKK